MIQFALQLRFAESDILAQFPDQVSCSDAIIGLLVVLSDKTADWTYPPVYVPISAHTVQQNSIFVVDISMERKTGMPFNSPQI